MLSNVKMLNVMAAMAQHSASRHAVIADNIANSDTPNYIAKDVRPFADVFRQAEQEGVRAQDVAAQTIMMDTGGAASPNGNTVSLEQQMMLSTQNKADHDMALAVYKKTLDMMKMAIGKNL